MIFSRVWGGDINILCAKRAEICYPSQLPIFLQWIIQCYAKTVTSWRGGGWKQDKDFLTNVIFSEKVVPQDF